MLLSVFNGRTLLATIALAIVLGSVFYADYLSKKLESIVKQKVETWVEAQRTLLNVTDGAALDLAIKISSENDDIPIIETNENDIPTGIYKNIDSIKVAKDSNYLTQKVKAFKQMHEPFTIIIDHDSVMTNKYYYGNTRLQNELKYFPIIQLLIIALFISLLIINQQQSNKSKQNLLWVGMAKETAHQLGTPITSLSGWIEILKDKSNTKELGIEIEKDVDRLKLVSDRFSKIGSKPALEDVNIVAQVENIVSYIKRIAGERIFFNIESTFKNISAKISPPLFDWVIENLLKNALDAMEKKGNISIFITQKENKIIIDVTDTGKGIALQNFKKVFEPGFTTKKRGWGLGLALTKRIVEEYHYGKIFVKSSEPGKGTTFRIELYRS